ncbi:MAG: Tim44 domain-containing protein [Curvibacter sp.]|nr:Tim44 domain-containing protein [Curvibacter sp.]
MLKLWSWVLVLVLAMGSLEAQAARRLGSGRSIGQQSTNVTRQANAAPGPAPAAPATAAAPTAPAAKPAPAAGAAPAPAPAPPVRKPWAGLLGGLAAGLGLAWLAQSLGLGPALAQGLMLLVLALVLVAVFSAFRRSRAAASGRASALAVAGSGGASAAPFLRQYSPDHVGNDASARPWERHSTFDAPATDGAAAAPVAGLQIGSALAAQPAGPGWRIPADFDVEAFLAVAKRHFVTLQGAWDRSDIELLRSMMTDAMLGEIRAQLAEREAHRPGEPNATEVVMLEARLLGIEDLADDHLASVEFSGLIREEPSAGPSPFREVWNLIKPREGQRGWLVAGVQALQ